MSAVAVQFITLTALHSSKKGTILNSLKTVLLLKAAGSPHSPVTAYFAVTLQGLLGELLFLSRRFIKLSAALLGMLSSLFSGAQKLFVLWLMFGTTFYAAVDSFVKYAAGQLLGKGAVQGSVVETGALIYLMLHAVTGIAAGIFAGKLPQLIESEKKSEQFAALTYSVSIQSELPKRKKRRTNKRYIIAAIAVVMVALSYLLPPEGAKNTEPLWLVIFRPLAVMFVWYVIVSPAASFLFKRMRGKENDIKEEETAQIKAIIAAAYRSVKSEPGNPLAKLSRFSIRFFALIS